MHVPRDICGNLTIVRVFGRQLVEDSSAVGPGTIIVRNIVRKETEPCMNVAPNQSEASNLDETHEAVMEELESSDYVSTLRDPNETLYGRRCLTSHGKPNAVKCFFEIGRGLIYVLQLSYILTKLSLLIDTHCDPTD